MTASDFATEQPIETPIIQQPESYGPALTGASLCGVCHFAKGESSSRTPAFWIWMHLRESHCGWVAVCRFCRTRTELADHVCDLRKPAAQH